jgi:hypothetical protein
LVRRDDVEMLASDDRGSRCVERDCVVGIGGE